LEKPHQPIDDKEQESLARAVLCVPRLFTQTKGTAMKKLLLASAVTAVFAAPATVFAQAAAPAVPTLDKVLEASGISLSGYIDGAYSHSDRNIESGGFTDRVFDSYNNSFVLHQVGLTVAKQPKEGFGGLVNITAGKDAQLINSFGATSSQFDVTQAYGQYASGSLTLIGGKFTTLAGTEVIASTGNTTFSRSILFGAVPFTHTGLRATLAPSDKVSVMVGVNNGWDQLQDANKGKTVELGATFTPIKPLTITVSDYNGQDSAATGGAQSTTAPQGARNLLDAVVSWTVIDPLSLGFEYLSLSQENFTSLTDGTSITAKYNGYALYATYTMTPKWRGVLRAESFDDKDGFHFGTAATKYKEYTLDISFLPADSYEVRGEVRTDRADNDVFTQYDGTMSKTLMTFALEGIYKF
jgi:hypothetical protein